MRVLMLLILAISVAACSTTSIQNEAGDDGSLPIGDGTVKYVADRHDDYVAKDATLSDTQKAEALADTIVVRAAFRQEKVEAAPIAEPLNRTLVRHDAYVDADPKLSPSWKGLAKLQSRSLKRLLDTALGVKEPPPNPKPAPAPATPAPSPPVTLTEK